MPIEKPPFLEGGSFEKKQEREYSVGKPLDAKQKLEKKPAESTLEAGESPKKLETKEASTEEMINSLIELAFEEGDEKAVEKAKNLNNPEILDGFHDRLVEEKRKRDGEHRKP